MSFLIFAPGSLLPRIGGFYICALQLFYIFTGNHGIWNWNIICLTIISVSLFPNSFSRFFRRSGPPKKNPSKNSQKKSKFLGFYSKFAIFICFFVIMFGAIPLAKGVSVGNLHVPDPLIETYRNFIFPLKIVNFYGPFPVQQQRIQLVIQYSFDAHVWYDFNYHQLPDSQLNTSPPLLFFPPVISRLDYQLWIAASSEYEKEIWFVFRCFCF